MRSKLFELSAFTCAAVILGWTAVAFSQGSGSSRTTPAPSGGVPAQRSGQPMQSQGVTVIQAQPTRPQTPEEFYSSFWNFIVKKDASYDKWNMITRGETDDATENPHGSKSHTYANKTAAGDVASLPLGSILVREDYDDKGKRTSINVMYRVKDFDKDHGNWYWLKYGEKGSISRDEGGKAIAGKVAKCAECHAKAGGKDFVFSNDPASKKPTGNDGDKSEPAKTPDKE